MDFRCRRTSAPDESNPDTYHERRQFLFEGRAVAFYRKDTRYAETLTDLRMREATVAIAPVTFTSFVFRVDDSYRQPASIFLIEMRAAYGGGRRPYFNVSRVPRKIYFFRTLTIERMYVPIDSAHDIFYNDGDRQRKA